jgi:hypothetical protein
MQSVKEAGGSRVQVERSVILESNGQEKKVSRAAHAALAVPRQLGSVRRAQLSPDDLGLYRSAIGDVRKQAVDILNYLIRYDDGLTLKQAEQLTYCTITIQQAAEP